jgi:hypothetical protein
MDDLVRARAKRRLSIAAIALFHLLLLGAVGSAFPLLLRPCLKTLAEAVAAPFRLSRAEKR